MSFDRKQFRELVERVLDEIGLKSEAAVRLVLGTAAQESGFGTYLKQIHGPAVGICQMEPATFDWLRDKYKDRFPQIEERAASEMEWDLKLAIVMCRLRYLVVPDPLPSALDLQGIAEYWKKSYNTIHGKGTVEQFVANYKKFVT